MLVKPTTFLPVAWLLLFLSVGRVDAQYRPYRLASIDQRAGADAVRLPSAVDGLTTQNSSATGRGLAGSSPLGDEGAPVVPPDIQSVSPSGHANEFIQSGPVANDHLMQWGAGSHEFLSPYMMKPTALNGFFFQWDQLIWTLADRPDVAPIGNPAAEGWVSRGDIGSGQNIFFLANDMNTDVYNGRVHSGQRFEFGNAEGGRGWFSSISFGSGQSQSVGYGVNFMPTDNLGLLGAFADVEGPGGPAVPDGIDDDVDNDLLFGRFGRDTDGDGIPDDQNMPIDLDDAIHWGISLDQLHVRDVFEFSGAEINRTIDHSPGWQWFYGVRYADFREWFSLTGSGGMLSPFELSTTTKNQIFGPQIGLRYNRALYKCILNIEGRFLPGYNHQSATQNGFIALNEEVSPSGPASMLGSNFSRTADNDEFSAVGEWRVDAILPINRFAAFRFGYTGLVMSGISYASPKVVYDLPHFGLSDVSSDETVLINAFTVGLEINR